MNVHEFPRSQASSWEVTLFGKTIAVEVDSQLRKGPEGQSSHLAPRDESRSTLDVHETIAFQGGDPRLKTEKIEAGASEEASPSGAWERGIMAK